jgi:tetratricopeptide (TPR) repeat protein
MTQEDEIEQLQKELQENPKSPQFVKLAEVYLSRDMVSEAEFLVKQSLKFHPRSTSGLILMGRIFKLKKMHNEALKPLSDATKLATENWRAWLELAESYLELKNGKQALLCFKKVLFFNPTHPLARRAVAKLELLTADEYEDDIFQMQKLPEASFETQADTTSAQAWKKPEASLVREISFIDALIVRHDIDKALNLLNACSVKYGQHPEIESRRLKLSVFEKPDYLQPKSMAKASLAKQKITREKKIATLEMLLRRIEANKSDLLST